MTLNNCDDCCARTKTYWVLIDGDTEAELCRKCLKALKDEGFVKVENLMSL